MLLGLNLKLPNLRSLGGYVPVPGAPFIVKDSAGTDYTIGLRETVQAPTTLCQVPLRRVTGLSITQFKERLPWPHTKFCC